MEVTAGDIKFMQECLARDVIEQLCLQKGMSIPQAMHALDTAETFRALSNPETHMFSASSVYVYDCLERELEYGNINSI